MWSDLDSVCVAPYNADFFSHTTIHTHTQRPSCRGEEVHEWDEGREDYIHIYPETRFGIDHNNARLCCEANNNNNICAEKEERQ